MLYFYRDADATGKLTIRNNQVDTIFIQNGNVGIGTTTPSQKLEVDSNVINGGIGLYEDPAIPQSGPVSVRIWAVGAAVGNTCKNEGACGAKGICLGAFDASGHWVDWNANVLKTCLCAGAY
ncbi:MAG: hypothetical protein ABIB79_04640 [archaeon]